MTPEDHKTAPRCPIHRAPMSATGEQREGRDVFRCIVNNGRNQCSVEVERRAGFVPSTTSKADAEL